MQTPPPLRLLLADDIIGSSIVAAAPAAVVVVAAAPAADCTVGSTFPLPPSAEERPAATFTAPSLSAHHLDIRNVAAKNRRCQELKENRTHVLIEDVKAFDRAMQQRRKR